jgi:hypothetical protein
MMARPLAPLAAERLESSLRGTPVRPRLQTSLGLERDEAAVARGASMSYEDAVEYALLELDRLIGESSDG